MNNISPLKSFSLTEKFTQQTRISDLLPVNILKSDQRCFNVVYQRWSNVYPTLKMKQNPTSDFQRCTTLMPDVETTLKQRWYNFISTLFQLILSISKSYIKPVGLVISTDL